MAQRYTYTIAGARWGAARIRSMQTIDLLTLHMETLEVLYSQAATGNMQQYPTELVQLMLDFIVTELRARGELDEEEV